MEKSFKFNTENKSLEVFEVHFQRIPLNATTQASPWVNSFFTKTYYLNTNNNNTKEAINANKNWLCENKEKIIDSIGIITNNTIITPSNLPPDNSQIATLISGMRDAHQRIMADYQQQLKEAAISNEKREKIFNEKEQKREKFYNEKLKELEVERDKLDKASHKSERRKLFSKVTDAEQLSKRKKSLSLESRIIRWGIVMVSIFCASISFYITISCINSLNYAAISTKEINWIYEYLIFKSVASSAVAIASLVFAARWMQSFYKEDVKRSEEVERFNADMIRASWAIETILEVQEEYKKEVPEVLIKGMITGLFEDKQKESEVNDASLALQALLAFTGSASFGPNGPTIEIGKKEAKALSKAKPSTDEEK